jgi:hypothetical protein
LLDAKIPSEKVERIGETTIEKMRQRGVRARRLHAKPELHITEPETPTSTELASRHGERT